MSLVNFIKLPAKMFQLYMGKFSFDLPMEESKKSWLFDNGLIYLKMAAVGPISVSSSFKNATAKFSMNAFVVSCNAFFFFFLFLLSRTNGLHTLKPEQLLIIGKKMSILNRKHENVVSPK